MNPKINTILIWVSAGLIILVIWILTYLKFFSSQEDYWLCNNWVWIKHGNPKNTAPTIGCTNLNNNTWVINTGAINTASWTWIISSGSQTIEDKENEQLIEEIDKMFKDMDVQVK